jgi:hypothetical protein
MRYLSNDALALLSLGRDDHRLTDDELLKLELHMKIISGWADRVPQETKFLFVKWPEVLVSPRVASMSRNDLGIACLLQPLHSQLYAMSVQVLWKASQLIRALSYALNLGDLIAAATMARSLVETTASFGTESNQISRLWMDRARQSAPDIASLDKFLEEVNTVVGQVMFGTKLKKDKQPETGIERTNIMTLIDKAEKLSENPGLRRLYEVLCDTVHPSIGSSRAFWTSEPVAGTGSMFEFQMQRHAPGVLGDLPYVIGSAALWSLVWLGLMWNLFDRTLRDMCLTARIYELPEVNSGVVRPTPSDDFCICGSTRKSADCPHYFGRVDVGIDLGIAKWTAGA